MRFEIRKGKVMKTKHRKKSKSKKRNKRAEEIAQPRNTFEYEKAKLLALLERYGIDTVVYEYNFKQGTGHIAPMKKYIHTKRRFFIRGRIDDWVLIDVFPSQKAANEFADCFEGEVQRRRKLANVK